jgi:micrococcal nuclease
MKNIFGFLILFSLIFPLCGQDLSSVYDDGTPVAAATERKAAPVYPDGVGYEVVNNVDGDTADVLVDEVNHESIRMICIDTPESNFHGFYQKYGNEAKEALKKLLPIGKKGTLKFQNPQRDQYGRLLAYIYVGDTNINLEMVKLGWAAIYIYHPWDSYAKSFLRESIRAYEAGKGIWSKTDPLLEMPYEFRRRMSKSYPHSWMSNPQTSIFVRPTRIDSVPAYSRFFFLSDSEAEAAGYKFVEK